MNPADVTIDRLIEVRRYAEARQRLEQRFAESPGDPGAHVQAARIAVLEGEESLASEHIAQALRSDPRHVGARWIDQALRVARRDWAAAEEVLLGLIREYPAEPDFIAEYARLMLFTGNVEKATALVQEALRLEPQHQEARLVGSLIAIVEGRPEIAGERLADIVRDDPESYRVAMTLCSVLIEQNRQREAYELGRELLRARPDNQHLVDLLVELRAETHPLGWPLYPVRRWGWAGAGGMWIAAIVTIGLLRRVAPRWAGPLAIAYVAFAVYSWVYPLLMRRWLRWRGLR